MKRLQATIPAARFSRYQAACAGTSVDPIDLYIWAGSVALAVFDDLGHVEVAMRSAIAERLFHVYGDRWYTRTDILDYPTKKLIDQAWQSGGLSSLSAPPAVVHGKLVATLMFGFWIKLLGKGTNFNGHRRIYDTTIWKAGVRDAFPNVSATDRALVERAARDVKELRNRVAHHEHIVWGVPIPGQRDAHGSQRRDRLGVAHDTLLELAGYLDTDLRTWLEEHSRVRDRIAACPVPDLSRFFL